MIQNVLFILAALATIGSFALDVWREFSSPPDDEGKRKKKRR